MPCWLFSECFEARYQLGLRRGILSSWRRVEVSSVSCVSSSCAVHRSCCAARLHTVQLLYSVLSREKGSKQFDEHSLRRAPFTSRVSRLCIVSTSRFPRRRLAGKSPLFAGNESPDQRSSIGRYILGIHEFCLDIGGTVLPENISRFPSVHLDTCDVYASMLTSAVRLLR